MYSTGYDKTGASKDEQADCKASEGVILPTAGIYSSGAETQPDSKNAHLKIKNETHGLIIHNIPEILEGTPTESRTHGTQAISERILAPPESVEILRPKTNSDTPCSIKAILNSAAECDLLLSRKSILLTQKINVFFHEEYRLTERIIHNAVLEE